jgi:hypothetical protein
MTSARRIARHMFPIAVLVVALGNVGHVQWPAATHAARSDTRYTSTAYGYSLLIPASWVRIPNVHWTPLGVPADVTVMTPDHQAALGVLVAPTGNTTYTDDELLSVATHLLYQENDVPPQTAIQTKRSIVNTVAYETAAVYRVSGSPSMLTSSSVAVAQRHHRLYAIATVAYYEIATLPPPGSDAVTPTPTQDTGGIGQAPPHLMPAAVPTLVPGPGAVRLVGSVGSIRPDGAAPYLAAAPPAPLPSDHLRGNPCPVPTDGGLVVIDKNCAYLAERQVLQSMQSSFTIDPHGADDPRPAATVGLDGFVRVTDAALGFTVAVPAQWATLSLQGTALAVRSPDQNALDVVQVQTGQVASPTQDELQADARAEIAEIGNALASSITYRSAQINGSRVVLAFTPLVSISKPNFNLASARATVIVAAYNHRIYSVLGATVMSQTAGDSTPVIYPFFSPFTDLARGYQVKLDTHYQDAGLASQTVLSLVLDPHVAAPR